MAKSRLGRGLSSLIPQKKSKAQNERENFNGNGYENNGKTESIFWIEIEKIQANPEQPRQEFDKESLEELADSIRRHGIIQPLVVTKIETPSAKGIDVSYQLIAGERRLKAAKMAGLYQVPSIIRRMESEKEKLEVALVENIQRKDLNPMEKAEAYLRLAKEFNLTQAEVGKKVGKSRESVANAIRLLELPSDMKQALREGRISEGHARAILAAGNQDHQKEIFSAILTGGVSVRKTEELIASKNIKIKLDADPYVKQLISRLEDRLNTKVKLKGKTHRGVLAIDYYSKEELQNIADKIAPEE
ncbi:MAG: ParB/RepB/Spo0J family partition protein [Parcubacteria group bacterium]|nr:ParB/RepB/Spo0J family partition protein [Parcubacteria group bacterium]